MDSIKSSDKLLSIYHPHHLRPDDFDKPYSKAATINNFTLDCASKFETLLSELTNDDLAVLHNRIHEFRSGSTWKLEHLLVFNVVPVLDLDWRKVIPQEYNPNNKIDQTNVLKELLNFVTTPEVFAHGTDVQAVCRGNPFIQFFKRLQELRARYTTELPNENNEQSISNEQNESKPEKASEELMHAFVEVVKDEMTGFFNKFQSSVRNRADRNFMLLQSSAGHTLPFTALQYNWSANSDGYLYLARPSSAPSVVNGHNIIKTRYSRVPIVSFEAKSRTSKQWWYTVAQEFAEMLASVQANIQVSNLHYTDFYEAYSISIKHTSLSIANAHFSSKYVEGIANGDRLPNDNSEYRIYFRQTRFYDLKEPNDREHAVVALMAMFNHIASGNAHILKVQHAIQYCKDLSVPGQEEEIDADQFDYEHTG